MPEDTDTDPEIAQMLAELEDSVWAVKIGDAQMEIRDLPIREGDRICRTAETNWGYVCGLPWGDLRVAELVINACAKRMGVAAPKPDDITMRNVMDFFTKVENDLPEEYSDGVPQ